MIEYDRAKSVAKKFFEGDDTLLIPPEWELDHESFGDDKTCLIVKTEEDAYFFKSDDFE